MSGCLTRDGEDPRGHLAQIGCSQEAEGGPALSPAELDAHVYRADLARRLQGAREEAKIAGQRLATQAMVRPSPIP